MLEDQNPKGWVKLEEQMRFTIASIAVAATTITRLSMLEVGSEITRGLPGDIPHLPIYRALSTP